MKTFYISRRSFLAYGSACVAGTLYAGPLNLAQAAQTEVEAPVLHLPLGYCPGETLGLSLATWAPPQTQPEGIDLAAEPLGGKLLDARSLGAGDPSFAANGARITVFGVVMPATAPLPGIKSASMDLFYEVDGCDTPIRFHAWSLHTDPVRNVAAPGSWVIPVLPDATLHLSVMFDLGDGKILETPIQLTSGGDPASTKLQRGAYFAALTTQGQESVAWSRFQRHSVGASDTTGPFHLVTHGAMPGSLVPADFPYLVFTVDYAEPEPTSMASTNLDPALPIG